MILGTDFRFSIESHGADTTPIELMTELYKGIIFNFTSVTIKEQTDGTATLKFGYNLIDTGEYKEDKLRGDKLFEEHLGLILNTLILDTLEIENANGESDTEVVDEERGLLS
jgi:hypothetical protein